MLISIQKLADIRRRRLAGESYAAISRIHWISREYVAAICKSMGYVPSRGDS